MISQADIDDYLVAGCFEHAESAMIPESGLVRPPLDRSLWLIRTRELLNRHKDFGLAFRELSAQIKSVHREWSALSGVTTLVPP